MWKRRFSSTPLSSSRTSSRSTRPSPFTGEIQMRETVVTDETLVVSFAPAWPFEQSDLDALYEIHSDEQTARYLYNEPRSREQVEELLERKIAGASIRAEGDWLSAAAVLRATGEVVCD